MKVNNLQFTFFESLACIYLLTYLSCVFVCDVVAIYNQLTDRNVLNHYLLATKVMPSLIPHAVSPALNISQVKSNMRAFKTIYDNHE